MPEANFTSFPSNQIGETQEHLREVLRPRYSYVTSPSPFVLPYIFTLSPGRLCRNSVHGSTGSPRTDNATFEINYLAVRPELVEGRISNCDTISGRRGHGEGYKMEGGHWSYQDLITPSNICAKIMLTGGNERIFMQESASGNTGYIPSKLLC